jgi:hypothetical protein
MKSRLKWFTKITISQKNFVKDGAKAMRRKVLSLLEPSS